jgi:hypothetical protein
MYRIFLILSLCILSIFAGGFFALKSYRHCPLSSFPFPEATSSPQGILEFEELPVYPWDTCKGKNGKISIITRDYFRCKGSSLHPPLPILKEGKVVENIFDCNGGEAHSLPIRNEKEFVYPILPELLNEIQASTGKPVIITSGHRCPNHNRYVDSSPKNQASKHQIGAEVSFYVAGLEKNPEQVLNAIFSFYTSNPRYTTEKKAYSEFERYEKETDVSTKPWFNKEIMIKLYKESEGRNGDNRHPFPYFSIQVRFDRDTNMRVSFSWNEAQQFYRK